MLRAYWGCVEPQFRSVYRDVPCGHEGLIIYKPCFVVFDLVKPKILLTLGKLQGDALA